MIIKLLLISTLSLITIYGVLIFRAGNFYTGLMVSLISTLSIIFVYQPELSNRVAYIFGVGRGADLLLYLFFLLFSVLIVIVHAKFRYYEQITTTLTREISLLKALLNEK